MANKSKQPRRKGKKTDTARLREIIFTLRRYKVLESLARQEHPERVRMAFEDLGPTFVKIGQLLSIRTDLIGDPLTRELKKLQSQTRTTPFLSLKPHIEASLGAPIGEVFAAFNQMPLASASIAQVHRGTLKTGEDVVVKIQHPNIREDMMLDLSLLERAVHMVGYLHIAKSIDPAEMVDELKKALLMELDFTVEAKNTERFHETHATARHICSPRVYEAYSSSTLIVMDFMPGVSIQKYLESRDTSLDLACFATHKKEINSRIMQDYLTQIFEDGFFHADPHPGNIFLDLTPEAISLVFLDFGLMGTLDEKTIHRLNEVLVAVASRKSDNMAQALLAICKTRGPVDRARLEDDLHSLFVNYFDMGLEEIEVPALLGQVATLCRENNLVLPDNITLLFKGLMTIEGVLAQLDPDFSMSAAIGPYVERYLRKQFDIKGEVRDFLQETAEAFRALPQIPTSLNDILRKVNAGKLMIPLEIRNAESYLNRIEKIVNRLAISIIFAALVLGFSWLVQANDPVFSNTIAIIGVSGLSLVFVVFVVLAILSWRRRK